MKLKRCALFFAGILALGMTVFYLVRSAVYLSPEITITELGGRWSLERTRYMGGTGGGHVALVRQTSVGRETIAPMVYNRVYLGDDCVLYSVPKVEGGPECLIACAEEPAQLVVEMSCQFWEVNRDQFQRFDTNENGRKVVETIEIEKLKSRARGN